MVLQKRGGNRRSVFRARSRAARKGKMSIRVPIRVRPKTKAVMTKIASTVARREMSRISENKEAYRQNSDYPVKANLATADYGSIIPTVSQGVTVQGRIGDELKCKRIYVKGLVQLDFNALSGQVYPAIVTSPTLYVRVMCIESKTYAAAGVQSTSIFKKNGSTFAPTANTPMNLFDPIDTDTYTVHYNRVFKLQNSLATGSLQLYQNPNFSCFKPFSFKLMKNKKLIFDTNSNDTCLNHQPQLLAFACDPQGVWTGTGVPVVISYRSIMYYEDN